MRLLSSISSPLALALAFAEAADADAERREMRAAGRARAVRVLVGNQRLSSTCGHAATFCADGAAGRADMRPDRGPGTRAFE